ncbi:hypothetical protein YQE_09714, partial [Dendroctonus ponderosae]
MKTYSRKKLGENVDEEIVDLDDVCRLCMEKEDDLISIFTNEETVPLTLRILACVSLEVFEDDGLPDKICHPCKFQLEKSYNFRKKCEQSDMKLRLHLKELKYEMGDLLTDDGNENQSEDYNDGRMDVDDHLKSDSDSVEPCTEEDIVVTHKKLYCPILFLQGVTKVSYIQGPEESENTPSNITLPIEVDQENKEACTLKTNVELKSEPEEEENIENIFVIEEDDGNMNNANMGAIADAVKATLANQPGGQLQLKVNPSEGASAQVEVTTEDGHVIVMEIMTEEEEATRKLDAVPSVSEDKSEVNEDGELKVFQCPECPKSFARRIQLRRHASVHMQKRGFSCGICEKWFPTRSALTRHERIHTGERPFQCEICSRSFAQKEILLRHLMTHTGQRPYSCPRCPKGFNQKEQLKIHVRTHGNSPNVIQLHYCSLCPKVFCHASGLSRHLVTHTGKVFQCSDCNKTFTDKSSLRRHLLQTGHQSQLH